jgi:hypothetical protein
MENTLGSLCTCPRGLLWRRRWKLGDTIRSIFMVKFPEVLASAPISRIFAQWQALCGSSTFSFLSFPSIFGLPAVIGYRPFRGVVAWSAFTETFWYVSVQEIGEFILGFSSSWFGKKAALSLLPSQDSWRGGRDYVTPVTVVYCGAFVWIYFCVLLFSNRSILRYPL